MTVKILQINEKKSVYTFDIEGISTKTLMALSRHKMFDLTVQSSRYTSKKCLLESDESEDFSTVLARTQSKEADNIMIEYMDKVRTLAVKGNIKQDDLSMMMPQAYLYSLVATVSHDGLMHFLKLRGEESHAHYDIKLLAKLLKECTDTEPAYVFGSVVPCHIAIRKCYMTQEKPNTDHTKLITRVGITSKHMSVLRHILVKTKLVNVHSSKHPILYNKYVVGDNRGDNLINLQALLEHCAGYYSAIDVCIGYLNEDTKTIIRNYYDKQ